jgi:hypothetical protein
VGVAAQERVQCAQVQQAAFASSMNKH